MSEEDLKLARDTIINKKGLLPNTVIIADSVLIKMGFDPEDFPVFEPGCRIISASKQLSSSD